MTERETAVFLAERLTGREPKETELPYLRIGVVYDGKDGKRRCITGWRGDLVLYKFWQPGPWPRARRDWEYSASREVFLRHFTPKGVAA